MACTWAVSRMSVTTPRQRPPAFSTSCTVSSRSALVANGYGAVGIWAAMSQATTAAPSAARARAWARPCPRAAPVTIATLPSSSPMLPPRCLVFDLTLYLFDSCPTRARRAPSATRPTSGRRPASVHPACAGPPSRSGDRLADHVSLVRRPELPPLPTVDPPPAVHPAERPSAEPHRPYPGGVAVADEGHRVPLGGGLVADDLDDERAVDVVLAAARRRHVGTGDQLEEALGALERPGVGVREVLVTEVVDAVVGPQVDPGAPAVEVGPERVLGQQVPDVPLVLELGQPGLGGGQPGLQRRQAILGGRRAVVCSPFAPHRPLLPRRRRPSPPDRCPLARIEQ